MFAHDLSAHDLVEVVAQRRHRAGDCVYSGVRNDADVALLQGDRFARMRPVADSIQANEIAGHVKPHDLLVTVGRPRRAFKKSNSNGAQGFELIAGPEQPFATSEALAC
jgi:hypothetical protein